MRERGIELGYSNRRSITTRFAKKQILTLRALESIFPTSLLDNVPSPGPLFVVNSVVVSLPARLDVLFFFVAPGEAPVPGLTVLPNTSGLQHQMF